MWVLILKNNAIVGGCMNRRQQVMMQLGQYCNTTRCYECPIYESWKNSGAYNNNCMECLRFPEVAEKMDKAIKGDKE